MLASEQTLSELALPELELRAVARRVALPALIAGGAIAAAVLGAGHVHAFADAVRRVLGLNAGWALAGAGFEFVSLAGYVILLALVAGRTTPRIGTRESAQITLAGAAATRLLPTAGAGGAVVALWSLGRAGLRPQAAARTLLTFLVALYSVFLTAIVVSGIAVMVALGGSHGPVALSVIPAVAALGAITLGVGLGFHRGRTSDENGAATETVTVDSGRAADRRSRVARGADLIGEAVRAACQLVQAGDARLGGAVCYWLFDAAVLWAMMHAFGTPPALPVIALAYLVGQVANTLPIPGSVSGGMAGVLIAFGVPAGLALPAVLAYRGVAVWLPSPVALAALPGLRATIARWRREDAEAVSG